jgi:ribosomal protein S1
MAEMSWTKRINKPSELLKVGGVVEAVVIGIEKIKKLHSISNNSRKIHGKW